MNKTHPNAPQPGVWERWTSKPDTDAEAFARLVLDYVGPTDDPFLDGDAEVRRRARAILNENGSLAKRARAAAAPDVRRRVFSRRHP